MASETIADIVAEYRRDYEDMKAKRLYLPTAEYLRRLLDRIEAAAKRERVEVEADALSAGGLVEAMRHKPSNAAALHKAIDYLCERIAELDAMFDPSEVECLRVAFSAPPRNCDRFGGDYKMLHSAWFDWTGSPSGQNPDGTAKMAFGEWLLAPAKKGGAK